MYGDHNRGMAVSPASAVPKAGNGFEIAGQLGSANHGTLAGVTLRVAVGAHTAATQHDRN
jgi:hypothetical protein